MSQLTQLIKFWCGFGSWIRIRDPDQYRDTGKTCILIGGGCTVPVLLVIYLTRNTFCGSCICPMLFPFHTIPWYQTAVATYGITLLMVTI